MRNKVILHEIQDDPLRLSNFLLILSKLLGIGRNCSLPFNYPPEIHLFHS